MKKLRHPRFRSHGVISHVILQAADNPDHVVVTHFARRVERMTGRSVYQMSVAAADTEQAGTAISRIFCPDPDHVPPCPVPWESRSSVASGSVHFVFYATDDQAQEILAQVRTRGFGEIQLFKSVGQDGRTIDGSTVIEQFDIEQNLPER